MDSGFHLLSGCVDYLICNFPKPLAGGPTFFLKVSGHRSDSGMFFGKLVMVISRTSCKMLPFKANFPRHIHLGGHARIVEVPTASWAFIHGAIQESLEIMLDNVTWQTLSTWVRTCHVSRFWSAFCARRKHRTCFVAVHPFSPWGWFATCPLLRWLTAYVLAGTL